ncbi:hypothetical protein MNAN1_003149 [Malassezia nana]|uniref:Amino acid permease/ SLC12A domain-containing protein n=1 Tax=Malassezia nana TaxID=180528 RepID=A0AAF0EP91_9BASI|nr:hypothetical protein MNAN1_003149 [Malassezia nana]
MVPDEKASSVKGQEVGKEALSYDLEAKAIVTVEDFASDEPATPHESAPRKLNARQVAMLSMAGSICTNLFINVGNGLIKSGPISLIIGYLYLASILYCINVCIMEMVTYLPICGSLHRFVGAFVDPALGAASSFNYWTLTDDGRHLPMLNVMIPCLVLFTYFVLNIWDAGWFGEAEFWISIVKIITALGLLVMTIFLMCGANPHHDVFGFRYWTQPAPMNEYLFSGSKGRFCSVLAAIVNAAWAFQGPDMVAVIAGDTKNPRKVIPKAFRSVYVRLTVFFIGSLVAVGLLVPFDDPILVNAINNEAPGAARTAHPNQHFSAGNALVFAGSRSLQAMALEGKMFRVFTKVNRNGTPYVAVLATLSIGLLSFLQVSAGASQVLFYFIDVSTSSLLVT